MSSTVESRTNVIFGLLLARSTMILDALNSSRRWMRKTSEANFVRKSASSIAVSPPPTTATFFSLKKNPSQVAQPLTPLPMSCCSFSRPSHFALAPVAITTAFASTGSSSPSAQSLNGLSEKSTRSTLSGRISAPKRAAWASRSSIIWGPSTPSSYPGKFWTSEVSMSCPPDSKPRNTRVFRFALAAYSAAVYPASPDPTTTVS